MQHFDAVDVERVQRDCVVGRDRRGIQRADAVEQNLYAGAIETAQDRSRNAGREAGARDAGQAGKHFTDLRPQVAGEGLAGKHDRSGNRIGIAGNETPGDDDVGAALLRVGAGVARDRGGRRLRGGKRGHERGQSAGSYQQSDSGGGERHAPRLIARI